MIPQCKGKSIEDAGQIKIGQWVYGYVVENEGVCWIAKPYPESIFSSVKVDPKTVSLYSGWRDIEKKYINENDIITIDDNGTIHHLLVEFKNGSFLIKNPKGPWDRTYLKYFMENSSDFEPIVVGNIFDNPELVEK